MIELGRVPSPSPAVVMRMMPAQSTTARMAATTEAATIFRWTSLRSAAARARSLVGAIRVPPVSFLAEAEER